MKAKGSLIKQELEIEASKDEVEGFFQAIVPDFVRNAGGILSDNVRYWRWQNQISILQKVKEKVETSGLTKHQIPLKVLIPIIEHSSLEEEEKLQEKWSNMLANAITNKVSISPNFVAILSELSPTEVQVLDQLHKESASETDYTKRRELQFSRDAIQKIFALDIKSVDLIVENLYRLGLCQPPAGDGIKVGQYKFTLRTTEIFEFTSLGFEFVSACKWE
jgi:hypothetical protein